jgi:hypothetical protein
VRTKIPLAEKRILRMEGAVAALEDFLSIWADSPDQFDYQELKDYYEDTKKDLARARAKARLKT